MDIAYLAPELARMIGVSPSTLVLLLVILIKGANVIARLIPDTATGWKGALRSICALIGLHVASRIAPGMTINDVAKAALETPPITEKAVAEAKRS